jgi:hypothetical protein
VCGAPNWDEDTDSDIYPDDPAFCSKECAEKYAAEARAEAWGIHRALVDERDDDIRRDITGVLPRIIAWGLRDADPQP